MGEHRQSIRTNYLLNTFYQVLILIVPLITTPYISRVLGSNGVGIYSYTYSNVSYFLLVGALGGTTYGRREIAYLQDNIGERSRLFFELVIIRILTSSAAILGYVVYLVFFVRADANVAALQTIYLVAGALDIIWLFQGMEDYSRVVFRNTIVKIFNVILVFALIRTSDDVNIYTVILAGMTLVANLSVWCYVPKYIRKVPFRELRPFRHLKGELTLFLPTIAIQVYTYLDKTMIRAFSADAMENGYYEEAEKTVRIAISVITSLGTVMAPRIAKTFADGNRELMSSYMRKTFRFTWMAAIPVMFGIMGVSETFVPVFFGPGYDKVRILMPLYSILIVFVSMSYILGIQFLISIGKQNVYTIAVSASAAVNLLMNLVLIPRYLSTGATIATVSAECIGAAAMTVYCCRKGLLSPRDIFGDTERYWAAGIAMFAAVLLLTRQLETGVLPLLAEIAAGILVYAGMLLVLRDRLFLDSVKSIPGFFRKKAKR